MGVAETMEVMISYTYHYFLYLQAIKYCGEIIKASFLLHSFSASARKCTACDNLGW